VFNCSSGKLKKRGGRVFLEIEHTIEKILWAPPSDLLKEAMNQHSGTGRLVSGGEEEEEGKILWGKDPLLNNRNSTPIQPNKGRQLDQSKKFKGCELGGGKEKGKSRWEPKKRFEMRKITGKRWLIAGE